MARGKHSSRLVMAQQVDLHKHFVFLVVTFSTYLDFSFYAIRSLLPSTL